MPIEFDFEKDYLLEDDCDLLRPLQQNDWQLLLYFAEHEVDIWQYSLVPVAGETNLKAYINTALQAKQESKEYPFIVFDKRTQEYAGCTRFYDIQIVNKTLQLGYTWYGKSFQRTGLNRHCKYLLLQFAFETLEMERVEFRADANNTRSVAAMKAIGCTVEGILRSNVPMHIGRRRDSIILSILKDEWKSVVKEKLRAMLR